jgi:MSHA biogenesis protein MshQ
MTTATINTLTGVGAALMDATFKFNAGNVDGTATTGNFIAERWDGTKWSPTTRVSAAATSTRIQNVDISSTTNDFEIGEPFASFPPALGVFNAFDTTAPAGSVLGVIQTKQAGTAFSVRVVRIANNAIDTTYNGAAIQVQLVDASNNTGGYVTGCRSTWTTQIGTLNVTFVSGVATASFLAAQVPNVYREVRVRIGGGTGCSSDNFAIRPTTITADAADSDWQNATAATRTLTNGSATGGNVHAASDPAASTPRPFILRVTPQAASGQSASLYDGNPTVVSGYPLCTLPASCAPGTLSFTPGSWLGTGTRTNATAHYTEVGVISLQFEDTSFASVDANDGSTAATRTVPATGTASIGRFVPDNFIASTLVTPIFLTFNTNDASCSTPPSGPKRSFTYIGQGFGFSTGPSVRVTARNAAGTTTTNYKGSLWKIGVVGSTSSVVKDCTTPNVCLFTTTWSSPAAGKVAESYSYSLTPASTPNWDNGIATGAAPSVTINGNGTGDFAFAAGAPGDRLAFKRDATTPLSTFTASINDAITVTDDTEAGTSGNGTLSASVTFSSIAFDAGNAFRYGVVRLQDVFAPLAGNSSGFAPVGILAQYWNGTAFIANPEDNCTSFTEKNFVLYSHAGSITAANLPTPTAGSNGKVSMGAVPVVAGVGRVNVISTSSGPAPLNTITQPGSVKICLDLDSSSTQIDNACVAITPADKAYLQGRWVGTSYSKDPNAMVGFGLYGSQPKNFIYFRENY